MEDSIPARRPFYCYDYGYNNVIDPEQLSKPGDTIQLRGFRRPAGQADFVPTYQYKQDQMQMFNPRENPAFDCANQPAVGRRDFPLYHPAYWRGGSYKNTNLPTNPAWPTQWSNLEAIPVYQKNTSRISQMNSRQYSPCKDSCGAIVVDSRMYPAQAFSQCCDNAWLRGKFAL